MTFEDWLFEQATASVMQREAILWDFAVSGAFMNEITQMWQPSTGRWWVQ